MVEIPQLYKDLSDNDLVASIINGDENALKFLLIVRCGRGFKHLIYKYCTLKVEFDELINEIWIVLAQNDWKVLRNYKGSSTNGYSCKIENYIIPIASRLLWKKMDRRMTEINWIKPLYDIEGLNIPDSASEIRKFKLEVIDLIKSLSNPIERQVLMQYKIEGYTAEDVAKSLNTSVDNVYTIYHRAIIKLRKIHKDGGYNV